MSIWINVQNDEILARAEKVGTGYCARIEFRDVGRTYHHRTFVTKNAALKYARKIRKTLIADLRQLDKLFAVLEPDNE